ncbi:hypothetical protein KUL42_13210 [Alteromonas sp. KUL42]|uniref:AraC family transcriptional regulator n=1 Tax=Alteromonas sp. KUL42 TaxID=2480797 RepID=UPI001036B85E|nr:AraC family transcriptional regulator [Alteromonas sp. KUL42]TAP37140.1 AraC family transcriptional regulator [Alteromonas sp. KUL42]GEA06560.1 hypothetical protein KUL42_13210 [Alteromonas sp. KUL42]
MDYSLYKTIIPAASFSNIGIQFVPISNALTPYVQCIWFVSENASKTRSIQEKFYPDAGSSITFNITPNTVKAFFFHHAKVCAKQWELGTRYISIRLKPGAAKALLGIDIDERNNLDIELPLFNSPHFYSISRLLDLLYSKKAFEQIVTIQDWLTQLCQRTDFANQKWQGLLESSASSLTPPQQLANDCGMSRRTLERHLKKHFGFSPNQLHHFAQIRHARYQLMSSSNTLSDIALECGFFDQAHFTNMFREHALETPLQYRKRKLSQISN